MSDLVNSTFNKMIVYSAPNKEKSIMHPPDDWQHEEAPYLSVVAAARNDNHGGHMLERMQLFIDGLVYQCKKYQIKTELIIVEWNPPDEKQKLVEVLQWPEEGAHCQIRIIEVPQKYHRKYRYAEKLPLFQMIAKNVGIRRARGEFVLSTNIDLLFADELMQFIAARKLIAGELYRVDRYDTVSNIPLELPHEDQLLFCENNLLRINKKGQTIILDRSLENPELENVKKSENNCDENNHSKADCKETLNLPQRRKNLRSLLYVGASRMFKSCVVNLLKVGTRLGRLLIKRDIRMALVKELPSSMVQFFRQKNILMSLPIMQEDEPDKLQSVQTEEQLPDIHTNACGDFTLMHKDDWIRLRGYAEFELYSMHIDSVLCLSAYHSGIKEVILPIPMKIYHIEHTGGWTPETNSLLNQRLADFGISQLTYGDLLALNRIMRLKSSVISFNDTNWGLSDVNLPEYMTVQS